MWSVDLCMQRCGPHRLPDLYIYIERIEKTSHKISEIRLLLKMKETGVHLPSFGKQVQMTSLGGRQVELAVLCQPHSTPAR